MQDRRPRLLWILSIILFLLTAGVVSGITVATKAGSNQGLDIVTLSSRPDIVSGGTVLVRISGSGKMALSDVAVFLNSRDVTNVFQPEASGHSLLGLVGGLSIGKNNLTAKAIDKHNQPYLSARLTLTNYPITGPIFSGPHEEPFYCMTQLFKLPASRRRWGWRSTRIAQSRLVWTMCTKRPGPCSNRCQALPAIQRILLRRQPVRVRQSRTLCASRPERSTAGSTRRRFCMTRPKKARLRHSILLRVESPLGLYARRWLCWRLVHPGREPREWWNS